MRDHVKKAGEKCVTRDSRSLFDFQKKSSNSEIRLAEVKSVKCNSDVITQKTKTKKMWISEMCQKCVKSEKGKT